MAFEFEGKLYFAGVGNPTATLIEIDPEINNAEIVYYNINNLRRDVAIVIIGCMTHQNFAVIYQQAMYTVGNIAS